MFWSNDTITRSAIISPCQKYRYILGRTWSIRKARLCWIMLNPSTADHTKDDQTIRRCMSFAREWGFGGISVVNLFAWRATDPTSLSKVIFQEDIVGELCKDWTTKAIRQCRRTVAAWGDLEKLKLGAIVQRRLGFIKDCSKPHGLWCLGLTKSGHPKHPLYVPSITVPVEYMAASPSESFFVEVN